MMRILKEQRGSVTLLVALAMVALLGFAALVVDVGLMYWTRAQLATEADSAALAGGSELPAGVYQADAAARDYTARNGGDSVDLIVDGGGTSLTVNVTRTINLLFAQVFGYKTRDVTATATAAISSVGGANGAAPLGMPQEEFNSTKRYELKTGSGGSQRGNFQALALDDKTGANIYGKNLQYGYDGTLTVGQDVATEPGNKVGDTRTAIEDRIARDDRILIVPIIDPQGYKDAKGRDMVKIVGFAAFYIDSEGGNGQVYGYFRGYASGHAIAGNGPNYGLYSLRLSQ